MAEDRGRVRRRRVFYIPGYDPFPPRRYRELYRREARAQAALSGHEIALAPAPAGGDYGWQVSARIEEAEVATRVEVLVWSDIVERSMGHGIAATYLQLLRTARLYIGSGALLPLLRLRKGPVLATLYPVAMLAAQLALALALAWGAGALLARVLPWPLPLAALVLVWPVLAWFRAQDRHLFAWYLMHDFAFAASAGGAHPAALEGRIAEFAGRIRTALGGDADEVLVVGHSSGAQIAVSALADVLRADGRPGDGPALSLLTLGQAIPMASFLPGAARLRADLALLSASDALTWVDVSAPGDGCAFALCDPVAVSGVAPEGRRWPLVLSAAFSRTLRPDSWRRLRWRFFRLHFQYLCAFDGLTGAPGEYDYFRVTAGPLTLAARFAGRAPSPGRIERQASPHRSLAP